MHWEDKPPEWLWRSEGCRRQKVCSQRACTLSHMLWDPVWGKSFERILVKPTCWSWRAPWRGRRQPWQAPANINPGSSHFWKLILPSGWQAQFWSALSRGLGPEAYIPISWSVQLLRQSSLNNQLLRDPALSTNKPSSFCMGQDLAVKKTSNIFFFLKYSWFTM